MLSFIDWKNKYMPLGPISYTEEQKAAFKRLHDVDLDEEFENTAKSEYNIYLKSHSDGQNDNN